jgi:preprotein translocase subunit SecE
MAFLVAAAVFGYIIKILMNVVANMWGPFARATAPTAIQHGVPILCGAILFLFLMFNPRIRDWAGLVVIEISKIVWPSVKDTRSLTIVVCIIIVLCAILFSLFDLVSGHLVNFILDLEI